MKAIIPDGALNQHIAILGKTGSGKTTAAKSAIIEPLLEQHHHVAIVDPTDAWWGLRSSHSGKGPGYPCLVLGGDHGDLPLPPLGGAAVARLVMDQGINVVASTKHLTVGERTRWFIDFAGTINRLNRKPLHLVLDEAHNFAPQGKVPDPDTGKMLHAANTLASGGRSIGIRLVMITQRPQKLHKDTLTSADTLIAMRVLAPHDRSAVEDWIKGCGDMKQGREVLDSLASLQCGEGWIWYPEGGLIKRVTFPAAKTFDSSATPVYGKEIKEPSKAEINLDEIRAAMADAVKEAEANDPKLLRAEIRRLEKQIKETPPTPVGVTDIELQTARQQGKLEAAKIFRDIAEDAKSKAHVASGQLNIAIGKIEQLAWAANASANEAPATTTINLKGEAFSAEHVKKLAHRESPFVISGSGGGSSSSTGGGDGISAASLRVHQYSGGGGQHSNGSLPKADRLILTALAQYPQGRSKVQVAVLTGYAKNGGSFNNALGKLRSAGCITGRGENLGITHAGIRMLGSWTALPTGKQLLEHWQSRLGKAERAILAALDFAHPRSLTKSEVGERTGYEPNGGSFNNALGKLRTLELIAGRGEIRLSDNLA